MRTAFILALAGGAVGVAYAVAKLIERGSTKGELMDHYESRRGDDDSDRWVRPVLRELGRIAAALERIAPLPTIGDADVQKAALEIDKTTEAIKDSMQP